jgi:hypothetical protein
MRRKHIDIQTASRTAVEFFKDLNGAVTANVSVLNCELNTYQNQPCWCIVIGYFDTQESAYGPVLMNTGPKWRRVYVNAESGDLVAMRPVQRTLVRHRKDAKKAKK